MPRLFIALVVCIVSACRPDVASSGGSTGGTETMGSGDDTSGGVASSEASGSSGGPEMPGLPFGSGTRLRARVIDGGGGAKVLVGWHDTELGIDCTFESTPGGARLCAPAGGISVVFLDPTCEQPALRHTSGTPVPTHVSRENDFGRGECERTREPFAVGDALADDTPIYEGLACERIDVGPDQTIYPLEPAENAFVAFEQTVESRGDELAVEVLTATDGAWQLGRTIDVQRDAACIPAPARDLEVETRCIPHPGNGPAFESSSTFGNPSCTDPLAVTCLMDTCEPPSHMVEHRQCADPPYEVRRLGEVTTAEEQYHIEEGACVAGESAVVDTGVCPYFPIEGLVQPEAFPAGSIEPFGDGRLQTLLYVAGDGTAGTLGNAFWDAELEAICTPWIDDDVEVCASGMAREVVAYWDQGCVLPLVETEGCDDAGIVWIEGPEQRSVPARVLGLHDEDVGYRYVGDACLETDTSLRTLWRLDSPTTPAELFAPLERALE